LILETCVWLYSWSFDSQISNQLIFWRVDKLIICETCIWPGFRNLLLVGFRWRITNYKVHTLTKMDHWNLGALKWGLN
jgi:hypothetical protein